MASGALAAACIWGHCSGVLLVFDTTVTPSPSLHRHAPAGMAPACWRAWQLCL